MQILSLPTLIKVVKGQSDAAEAEEETNVSVYQQWRDNQAAAVAACSAGSPPSKVSNGNYCPCDGTSDQGQRCLRDC